MFLMQENRSFDHYFGTLQGVRGFGDPRAVTAAFGRSGVAAARTGLDTCCRSIPRRRTLGLTFLRGPGA